jgi:hypothetical protein
MSCDVGTGKVGALGSQIANAHSCQIRKKSILATEDTEDSEKSFF